MPEVRTSAAAATTLQIFNELLGPPQGRNFVLKLWDGTLEPPGTDAPEFTLLIRRPGALRRMLLPPTETTLAEGYLRDDFDVEGNLEATIYLSETIAERVANPLTIVRLARLLRSLPTNDLPARLQLHAHNAHLNGRQHSKDRDQSAVRSHYDVGNDFYALFLDRRMVYSCAYFRHPSDDLDTAQENKLEHICRKLRLQPGDRLLDIGCGWGGLIQYAVENYGVIATGITLSPPQADLARARIAAAGLSDRCTVLVRDYRDMTGEFDKVVSVGMFEHVGREKMQLYFKKAYELTRPGGLFLNHGIVEGPIQFHGLAGFAMARLWGEGKFVQKYVFPDGDLIRPGRVLDAAESVGFESRDVENLREHYVLTLRNWVRRLEDHHEEAVSLVGEETYRVWRLYMSAVTTGFQQARVGLTQTLLCKTERDGTCSLPMTREDIYQVDTPAPWEGAARASS